MDAWQERRYLTRLLAAQHKSHQPPRHHRLKLILLWAALTTVLTALFHYFGGPAKAAWPWVIGALIVGMGLGAKAFYDGIRDTWPVIQHHIDFSSVQARLDALNATSPTSND